MPTIRADRRSLYAEPDDESERLAQEEAARYQDSRLNLSRHLATLERKRTYLLSGCASIVEYGVRLGLASEDARKMVSLGRTLDLPVPAAVPEAAPDEPAPPDDAPPPVSPTVEERIRAGRLPIQNATALGRLLGEPGLIRTGEDWTVAAETESAWRFGQSVLRRIEESAAGRPLVPLSTYVSERTRENFRRARVLASQRAGVALKDGQTLALVTNHFLQSFDPLLAGEKARRVGPTAELPGQRYIPAAVRRRVLQRSGDRCEVRGCRNRYGLVFSHLLGHACGGSREEDNICRMCWTHHLLFDADVITFAGWKDGEPQFRNDRGELLADAPTATDVARLPLGGPPEPDRPPDVSDTAADAVGQVSERPVAVGWTGPDTAGGTAIPTQPEPSGVSERVTCCQPPGWRPTRWLDAEASGGRALVQPSPRPCGCVTSSGLRRALSGRRDMERPPPT